MMSQITFLPYVPWPALIACAVLFAVLLAFAAWRGLSGWPLRTLAAAGIFLALANPALLREDRDPLSDIVILLVDETASQSLADRRAQTAAARAAIEAQIASLPNTEVRVVALADADDNRGTLLMTRLSEALAAEPRARLAGVILLSDGQLHDAQITPDLPAPLHLLLTGQPSDWDRRLIIDNAPAFAILDEEITLTLTIEDQGAVPPSVGPTTPLTVSIDGGAPSPFEVAVGRAIELPLTLPHGGMNVLQFTVPEARGELTTRNNSAVVQINGVRDRLRVLLVSGEPHNGERTWRNLLKSDAAVDLVHFTILRPPSKQDGVPVTELSLIAFPTRELFMEKVDDFDLIIFDRYKLRGILPDSYLDNIARYVEEGGAVLFSAGPDFASADSIYRSALSRIIPVRPTGRVIDQGYQPQITDLGLRHPVTDGLGGITQADQTPPWGRWFRQIDVDEGAGEVVMSGADDRPLLVLDRVGEGRVAVLASDHAWLWSRGVEGGGPQLELLRRLAHWMMKEPDLEEEALFATSDGAELTVTRRSLARGAREVIVTRPDGTEDILAMEEVSPGHFTAKTRGAQMGLYRLRDGLAGGPSGGAGPAQASKEAVIVLGPAAPREFEQTIATADGVAGAVRATRGGVLSLSQGVPDLRRVGVGRPAAGRGWIGVTPRGAYATLSTTRAPLLPPWVWVLALSLLVLAGWLREGRK